MDILYIPQLDGAGSGAGGGAVAPYRLLERVPEDGRVILTNRAVTRVALSDADPLTLVLPPLVKGTARDFFVRLVITSDTVPEITFAAPSGETVSFEDTDEGVFVCSVGINVFCFTETDAGVFIVNRKTVPIRWDVRFDACGGELRDDSAVFLLGGIYGELPVPARYGYSFLGWYTQADGGTLVEADGTVTTSVTELYARWEVYDDPFVDAICAKKNLTFYSRDLLPWTIDTKVYSSSPGSARSGPIGHSERTTLLTRVEGRGVMNFKWKVSSEENCDRLHFIVDGAEVASIAGSVGWESYAYTFTDDAAHVVEWKYDKDGSVSGGTDCGWVDDVVWTPEGE